MLFRSTLVCSSDLRGCALPILPLSVSLKLDCSLKIWKETKRSVKRSCRDEMAADVDRRVVIAFIDSLKFSRTDIIREISVYVIGCL